ncbi:MAG: hypothetical protein WKG52_07455 [Variovorax sp.]
MLDKLNEFTESHGELQRGRGLVTGTIEHYGVVGDYVPNGFFKQLKVPFVWKG